MKRILFSLNIGVLPRLPESGLERGKWLLVLLLFSYLSNPVVAQQEPQFTHYMFNTLVYNPGYAGSREYMSAVALYRDQWFGWGEGDGYDGRPVTKTFSLHSPVNRRVGLGVNFVNDRIGARQTTLADVIYAYRIVFGKGTLSLGVQAGIMNWRADWDKLSFKDARELDNAFKGANPTLWLPDFGAGAFFYTEKFYAGVSMPHLAHFSLRSLAAEEEDFIRKWAKTYRHFYITSGGAIPLKGESLVLKPSFLIKSVGFFNEFFKQGSLVREIGGPATFDVDMSLLFHKKFWLGISYRSAFAAFSQPVNSPKRSSADSFDIWTAFYLKNGLRIGMSYDYPLNEIAPYTSGSFELMLGFDFVKEVEKANHPRYF
jgi:type IX secretion system PorP/SprF family membrane protein